MLYIKNELFKIKVLATLSATEIILFDELKVVSISEV